MSADPEAAAQGCFAVICIVGFIGWLLGWFVCKSVMLERQMNVKKAKEAEPKR